MIKPFYYVAFDTARGQGDKLFYSARVKIANKGYGHHHDPTVQQFNGFTNPAELWDFVEAWIVEVADCEVLVEPKDIVARTEANNKILEEQRDALARSVPSG